MQRIRVFLGLVAVLVVLHDGGGGGIASSISVSPSSGPEGGDFIVAGDGLATNRPYLLINTSTGGNEVGRGRVETDTNGHFAEIYHATGDPPGAYTVAILPLGGGPTLATAAYTIIGTGMETNQSFVPATTTPVSLPATGGGGMARPTNLAHSVARGAGIGALLLLLSWRHT